MEHIETRYNSLTPLYEIAIDEEFSFIFTDH